MYLRKADVRYNPSGQSSSRAPFLILLQPERGPVSRDNTYAVVRKVALRQLGNFRMGRANIAGKWESVSGSYGNDGLPMTVPKLPRDAVPLPAELFDLWNKGSAGSAMRDWARATFKESV